VQVIVYAGAIVVLFLFVIMLLGVDRSRTSASNRSRCNDRCDRGRPGASSASWRPRCWPGRAGQQGHHRGEVRRRDLTGSEPNIDKLARSLFSTYVLRLRGHVDPADRGRAGHGDPGSPAVPDRGAAREERAQEKAQEEVRS
jgi:hypothetical protein